MRLTALEARRETAGGKVADLEAHRAERDRLVAEIAAAEGALQGLQAEEAELRARLLSQIGVAEANLAALRAEETELRTQLPALQEAIRRLEQRQSDLQRQGTGTGPASAPEE